MKKQRARRPEEKAIRKQSIVDALRNLLLRSRYPLPSVNDIAKEAGVTKGVIYFYFHSREEIFLTLHMQESELFFEKLKTMLADETYKVASLRDFIVHFFLNNEIFMYLGLLVPGVLEANVSVEFARKFKKFMADGVHQIASNWVQSEPNLKLVSLRDLIMRYYYLSLMLWQHYHQPEVIIQAFPQKDLWIISGNLEKEFKESFDWLWIGMRYAKSKH